MRLSKAIRQNKDLIEMFLGNIDNIRSQMRWNDVANDLAGIEKKSNDRTKYNTLTSTLSGNLSNLNEDDVYNISRELKPGYEGSQSFKDYQTSVANHDSTVSPAPTYLDYISNNKDKYTDEYSKFVTENKTERGEDEIYKKLYETSRFTPEDIEFYEKYRKSQQAKMPYGTAEYNRDLSNTIFGNLGSLSSRGSRGNQYQNLAMMYLDNHKKVEPKPDYDIKTFDSGKVMKIDKNTGNYEIKDEPGLKKENSDILPQSIDTSEEGEGDSKKYYATWGRYDKTTGKLLDPIKMEVTKDKYDKMKSDQMTKEDIKDMNMKYNIEYKMSLSGLGLLGSHGKGGNGGVSPFTIEDNFNYSDLKSFYDLSKRYNALKPDEKKKYQELQKQLTGSLGVSWQELNKLTEKIGGMTEKQAKQYFLKYDDVLGKSREQIETAFQKVMKDYGLEKSLNYLNSLTDPVKFNEKAWELYNKKLGANYNKMKPEIRSVLYDFVNKAIAEMRKNKGIAE